MASNKYFFDANTIVEIALGRKNDFLVIEKLKSLSPNIYISTLTAHLVVYFGQKYTSLSALESLLSSFTILDLTQDDFNWAFDSIRGDDFEDALQLAVAIRNGCNYFYTFDKQLVTTYKDLPTLKVKLLR